MSQHRFCDGYHLNSLSQVNFYVFAFHEFSVDSELNLSMETVLSSVLMIRMLGLNTVLVPISLLTMLPMFGVAMYKWFGFIYLGPNRIDKFLVRDPS